MRVVLSSRPFDPWQSVQAFQAGSLQRGSYGATAVFVGTMRDFNEGERVDSLYLQHYPGMTERELERILRDARARWAFLDAMIEHRVGGIDPGEPIVVVGVWSAHRKEAFEACRWIMEALKSRAPFWKKESGPGGERWVERNTPG